MAGQILHWVFTCCGAIMWKVLKLLPKGNSSGWGCEGLLTNARKTGFMARSLKYVWLWLVSWDTTQFELINDFLSWFNQFYNFQVQKFTMISLTLFHVYNFKSPWYLYLYTSLQNINSSYLYPYLMYRTLIHYHISTLISCAEH